MISTLLAIIKIVFLLGFLIGIHETGHFLIAKLCKVKVNEFSIGFGPVIWRKETKETMKPMTKNLQRALLQFLPVLSLTFIQEVMKK